MKISLVSAPLLTLLACISTTSAIVTENDGDWSLQEVILTNTPEAALMVRYGDIDNLGFGWPVNFDPFSGNSTPGHPYPWAPPVDGTDGTDRVTVITSYTGSPPAGRDGYTSGTSRPANSVRPITLEFSAAGLMISDAAFQIFVDDFQAPVWRANYTVTLNGIPYPEMAAVINTLAQTGPVGKLISVPVPPALFSAIASGTVALVFDDLTTGAGDGYAIDFVKLLINSTGSLQTGAVSGKITDAVNSAPLAGATVTSFDQFTLTAADGTYTLTNIPAGLAYVSAWAAGHTTNSLLADVIAGSVSANKNLALGRAPLSLGIAAGSGEVVVRFYGHPGITYHLQTGDSVTTIGDIETILGVGGWVFRTNVLSAGGRFWRAWQ